jgi:hypothetical protein
MQHQTKTKLINVIASLFIFLFVYAALSKLFEFHLFKAVLHKSPLIKSKASIIAFSLPTIELVLAGLLFMKPTQKIGFYVTTGLMSLFSIYVLYMLLFVPDLPCSCGGVLKQLSWTQHLIFNAIFTFLSIAAIALQKSL